MESLWANAKLQTGSHACINWHLKDKHVQKINTFSTNQTNKHKTIMHKNMLTYSLRQFFSLNIHLTLVHSSQKTEWTFGLWDQSSPIKTSFDCPLQSQSVQAVYEDTTLSLVELLLFIFSAEPTQDRDSRECWDFGPHVGIYTPKFFDFESVGGFSLCPPSVVRKTSAVP